MSRCHFGHKHADNAGLRYSDVYTLQRTTASVTLWQIILYVSSNKHACDTLTNISISRNSFVFQPIQPTGKWCLGSVRTERVSRIMLACSQINKNKLVQVSRRRYVSAWECPCTPALVNFSATTTAAAATDHAQRGMEKVHATPRPRRGINLWTGISPCD